MNCHFNFLSDGLSLIQTGLNSWEKSQGHVSPDYPSSCVWTVRGTSPCNPITNKRNMIVCLPMWWLRMWTATFQLHTISLHQARQTGSIYAVEMSRYTSEVTTSWEKRFYHVNYGVIQGFLTLRKAVTTHVKKYDNFFTCWHVTRLSRHSEE